LNYFPNHLFVFESFSWMDYTWALHNNSDRYLDLDRILFSDLHWILKHKFWIGFWLFSF